MTDRRGTGIPFWQSMVFWSLLPVAGLQGLLLRRSAQRLSPPPGATSGTFGQQGRRIYLLAAGDSIIAGVGAARQEQTLPLQFARALSSTLDARIEWRIEGKNGMDLAGLVVALAALEPRVQADIILLSIGVNDVTGLSTTRAWRRQLQLLVKLIRSRWPRALVVFAGLPPMGRFPLPPQPLRYSLGLRAETLDRIAGNLMSQQNRMMHIQTVIESPQHDFCEDGFHPSENSYAVWAEELARRVAGHIEPAETETMSQ
jgi:lysophospholipase L1-like esterase